MDRAKVEDQNCCWFKVHQVSQVETSTLRLVKIKVSQISTRNRNSQFCTPLPRRSPGRVYTVRQKRTFWTRCLLAEPIPAVQSSCRVTAGVSSGLLTTQGFGVCENETSWRGTFIWISQQVSSKCVLRSITTKHTQPGLMDLIHFLVHQSDRLEGKGFFFNAMRVFSALQMITFLVHPVLPLNKEIMFRYKGCDWQSGREVPFLVTKARQRVGLFFYTNLQQPALGVRKLREGICQISSILKHQHEITPSPYIYPLLLCCNLIHLPSSKSAVPNARVQS